jgi:uncharacterized protein (UPF0276 family)
MDLQWGTGGSVMRPELEAFLRNYGTSFEHAFFSFQPRTSDLLINEAALAPMIPGYQNFQSRLGHIRDWGLHHTFLNMGSMESRYPRELVASTTNALTRRLGIGWINEDLGIWSLLGKTLAYPLPPALSARGLKASIENIDFYQAHLEAQLRVEFPGFSEGHSIVLGDMCALEYFRRCIDETGVDCVLDTGHILGYQWLRGRRGTRMFEGLEELLPVDACVEIHLSGCTIVGERFVDFHHGIIQDEQLELLDFLLERCPNLRTVTYEDPKFTADGLLIPKSVHNFEKLKERVARWKRLMAIA